MSEKKGNKTIEQIFQEMNQSPEIAAELADEKFKEFKKYLERAQRTMFDLRAYFGQNLMVYGLGKSPEWACTEIEDCTNELSQIMMNSNQGALDDFLWLLTATDMWLTDQKKKKEI
jgi:hypothetical protein